MKTALGVGVVVLLGVGGSQGVEVLGAASKKPSPPPTPTITSGPSGSIQSTTATFTFSDSQSGVSFQCSLDGVSAGCTSPTPYSALGEGGHTFRVIAMAGGLSSGPATRSWTVDHTAPAPPVFTNTPDDPTVETKAQFNYRAEAGATFACTLDGTPVACGPQGLEQKNLSLGTHTFTVVAVDAAGNRSAPKSFTWTIVLDLAFGINGDAVGPVHPGGSSPLNLRISNPYNFSIKVFTIDVTIDSTSTDCTVNANFDQPTRRRFTLTTAAVIPANSSRFLNDLRPDQVTTPPVWPTDWPAIAMTNTAVNQDSCKGTTFTLSYTGTATKS